MYILLYSKYSRSCLKLLDDVDQLNSMMGSPTPIIQLVCIDNKEIRNQILSSKSIEIKKVPCLLIVNDTTVEKYDGEKAFEWVSEIIQKMNVKAQPPQPPPPPPQTMIEIEPQHDVKQKRSQKSKTSSPPPQKRGGKTKKETKIEDLDDIEEEEEENDSEPTQSSKKIKKPPIPNRNGAGSYVIESNESEEKEDDEQEEENKSTNSTTKGMGVLDLAFAMRQEREKGK